MNRIISLFALVTLTGCELLEGGPSASETDTSDTGAIEDGSSNHPGAKGWTERLHTCPGDGVDTMWFDNDEQTLFIGCGSNAEGYGLQRSPDRGETWPDISTDPRGALGGRVNAVSRSGDGLLYVAGEQLLGGKQAVSVDTSVSPWAVEPMYDAGSSFDDVQLAGSFARTDDGISVVEALNGTQIAVQWGPGQPWQDAAGWAGGASVQMQDLQVHNNEFYGTGATMNMAPMVFLPPRNGHVQADGFQMVVIDLYEYAQELRNLDVDSSGGIVAGGVDHGIRSGIVYISNDDPRDAYDWTQVWVDELVGDQPSWIDGVCRDGDLIGAVGRFSTNNDPIALLSTDRGQTWKDLTPELSSSSVPSLYRCQFLDGGKTMAVAGANGFLGFYGR
jgi:hypothetical protein